MATRSRALDRRGAGGIGGVCACHAEAGRQERRSIPPKDANHPLPELISGYEFTPLKLRALQDDDFDNPGFVSVSKGERPWGEVEGAAQKSCASCHNNAIETMRGVGASYPKFQEGPNAVVTLSSASISAARRRCKPRLA